MKFEGKVEDNSGFESVDLGKLFTEKLESRLKKLAQEMVNNLTSSSPQGYTRPSYKSKPGGGTYFEGDLGDGQLTAALRNVKNQITVDIGPVTTLGIGSVSELDSDTPRNKGGSPGGYWRIFEGFDQYKGKAHPGGSKQYIFQPNGGGVQGEGSMRGPYSIGSASKYHPGVTPVHMFELTKKSYTDNFKNTVKYAAREAIREFNRKG